MLDSKQFGLILQLGMVDKINEVFSNHGLSNIRIFSAQFSDQYNKINFLARENDDADPLNVINALKEIKKLLDYKDVNILIENILDPEIKPIIEREIIDFSRELIISKQKGFNIECRESPQNQTVITITIDATIPYNREDMMQTCSQAVTRELEKNKLSPVRQTFF